MPLVYFSCQLQFPYPCLKNLTASQIFIVIEKYAGHVFPNFPKILNIKILLEIPVIQTNPLLPDPID